MTACLIVILFDISLMINTIKHLLILIGHFYIFFWKVCVLDFCSLKNIFCHVIRIAYIHKSIHFTQVVSERKASVRGWWTPVLLIRGKAPSPVAKGGTVGKY